MKFLSLRFVGILGIFVIHNPSGGLFQNLCETTGATVTTEIPAPTGTPSLTEPTDPLPIRASNKAPTTVINFINHKISQALTEYPKKDENGLRLAAVFNELRRHVAEAILPPTASKSDAIKAEQTIQRFLDFAGQYCDISERLRSAIKDLISIEGDSDQPLSVRFEALRLINQLRNCDTVKNAEAALQNYDDFKCELKEPTTPISNNGPLPLDGEYKIYFEGIFKIVRQDDTDISDRNV